MFFFEDFGLTEIRKFDEMMLSEDDKEDRYYSDKRNEVYIAPELKDGATVGTFHGDVYAYSLILVEIATRNDPFAVRINLSKCIIKQNVNEFYDRLLLIIGRTKTPLTFLNFGNHLFLICRQKWLKTLKVHVHVPKSILR